MEEGEEGGLVGGEEVEEVGESGECFKGKPHTRKTMFFRALPKLVVCTTFLGRQKRQWWE